MQPFCFFVATKEVGVRGLVPANKKLKKISLIKLKFSIYIISFLFNFFVAQKSCKKRKYYSFVCFEICIKCKVMQIFWLKQCSSFASFIPIKEVGEQCSSFASFIPIKEVGVLPYGYASQGG